MYLLAGDKVHRTNSLLCLLSLSCTLPHYLFLRLCVPQAFIASKFILSRGQGAEQGRIGYMDTYLILIEFVTRFFFFHPSINVNATLLPRAASPVRLYLTSSLQQLATASIGMCMYFDIHRPRTINCLIFNNNNYKFPLCLYWSLSICHNLLTLW